MTELNIDTQPQQLTEYIPFIVLEVSYVMSIVNEWSKIRCVVTGPHCIIILAAGIINNDLIKNCWFPVRW